MTLQVIDRTRSIGEFGRRVEESHVPLSTLQARSDRARGFPILLRDWRLKRRLSQMDLALTSGVSQRHVSCLELGRANPSRAMVLQLSETLEVPLRDRNTWLVAAGFAPIFQTSALEDPQMTQVMNAVRMMLSAHEPFPAVALDRAWNIRMANAAFERLGTMLGDGNWARVGGHQRNLMRLFFHPNGIRPFITNWRAIGSLIWQRALREAEAVGNHEMKAVLDALAPFQAEERRWAQAGDVALVSVMPFELRIEGLDISMFAVVATFGTAQDVTADELRIETLFPADAATEALFRMAAAGVE